MFCRPFKHLQHHEYSIKAEGWLLTYTAFGIVVHFLPPENMNSNRKLADFTLNRKGMDFKKLWDQDANFNICIIKVYRIDARDSRSRPAARNVRLGETHCTYIIFANFSPKLPIFVLWRSRTWHFLDWVDRTSTKHVKSIIYTDVITAAPVVLS